MGDPLGAGRSTSAVTLTGTPTLCRDPARTPNTAARHEISCRHRRRWHCVPQDPEEITAIGKAPSNRYSTTCARSSTSRAPAEMAAEPALRAQRSEAGANLLAEELR